MNEVETPSIEEIHDEEENPTNYDIDEIKTIFDNSEYAYPLEDVMGEFRNLGHNNPGMIITCAIQDELLYVDSIEDNGTVYLALVEE